MVHTLCCPILPLTLACVFTLLLPSAAAYAQSAEGFVVGSAGRWGNRFSSGGLLGAGAGVEGVIGERFSIGGEIGLLAGDGLFVNLTGTGRIRVGRAPFRQRIDPFISGGYSELYSFTGGGAHAWHAGAGLDYAVSKRKALRVEFRDTIFAGYSRTHHWALRFGLRLWE